MDEKDRQQKPDLDRNGPDFPPQLPKSIADIWETLGPPTQVLAGDSGARSEIWDRPDLSNHARSYDGQPLKLNQDVGPRVIVAARLARDEETGLRLGYQILECLVAAATHGYSVTAVISTVGYSGNLDLDDRGDLPWILGRIESGEADGALFLDPIRLARSASTAQDFFDRSRAAGASAYFAGALAVGEIRRSLVAARTPEEQEKLRVQIEEADEK